MATVVLSYAGAALGTLVGGPLGGIIGKAIGGIAGNMLDQQLFGGTRKVEGPRLNDLRVMASEEGAAIPALWGRMRIAGQVIWATNIEEVIETDSKSASGKGGPKVKSTTYSYFGNFAVGLCEGEIDGIGRIWADGKLLDTSGITMRVYQGSESQLPDSLIEAKEGAGHTPAYRGLAYVVFERLPLETFGNRLPQLSFEVFRAANPLASQIKAITIIPGATEFGYDTKLVSRVLGKGKSESENAHALAGTSDWTVSLDQLQGACPQLDSVSLVVAWYGNDLRCGSCTVTPRVESTTKQTTGSAWRVSGLDRASATAVSTHEGHPAFGGTPSDDSVLRAIADLKARGLKVMFYPFLLMDVPPGNAQPDPHGGTEQKAYPWRGRITASIAPGLAGTPDKTSAATAEIGNFLGAAQPSHFTVSGDSVIYSGPAEWRYRRMILHYAKLCALAGGVDAFLIGSELRGLTTLRNSASGYPFVAALAQLAAEVKAILPTSKISYAADWSEYFGHHPQDGSGDVFFHLDPLWSASAVDFIGIDNYMPLTDWRDGTDHLDAAIAPAIHDMAYLKSRLAGGEGYDWYYASGTDRESQLRTPIGDGAHGKPWVFRFKDLKSWWLNQHFHRPGGTETSTPTAWVPQSKPIWFTEAGCPAIDKGSNGPNVFVDAKSSESAVPHFSNGQRDDLIQGRMLQALHAYWQEAGAHNPMSSVYGQTMLDASRIHVWCWDARPFPAFPGRPDIWSDAANVARGHWLNGRLGSIDVATLIEAIAARYGLDAVDCAGVAARLDGFVIDRPMSGRDSLDSLLQAFAIDAVESAGKLRFTSRSAGTASVCSLSDVVEAANTTALVSTTRLQESDLPRAVRLAYVETDADYRTAAVSQIKATTASEREIGFALPAAVTQEEAQRRADVMLASAWSERERMTFTLPPSDAALDAGDLVELDGRLLRITAIKDGVARVMEAVPFEPSVLEPPPGPSRKVQPSVVAAISQPYALLLDLAMVQGTQPAVPWVAAHATPWPGPLALLRRKGPTAFAFNRSVTAQATMGTSLTAFPQGHLHRLDFTTALDVELDFGALSSVSEDDLLDGANVLAIGTMATGFEIVQFQSGELIAQDTYRLTGLLRGQAGSAAEMLPLRAAGQDVVLLNGAVVPANLTLDQASLASVWRLGPAALDEGHPSYLELNLPPVLKALRPLAPVHPRMRRAPTGIDVTWIRQTRISGDSWEAAEVPLGEETERYAVEVLDGSSVKRSATVTTPAFSYSDAQMTADFGAPQTTLSLRIAQLSTITGRGSSLERTLNV